jgi:hypothetical protein
LSTEVFDCDETTGVCPAVPVDLHICATSAQRLIDVVPVLNDNGDLASQLTVYLDDPASACLAPQE